MPPVHPVLETAAKQRAALLRGERQVATRLVGAYGRAFQAFGDKIDHLESTVAASKAAGKNLTPWQANRLPALRSLRKQVVEEINKYAIFADQTIAQAVTDNVAFGLRDSKALTQAYFQSPQGRAAVNAAWDVLGTEQVETMIGMTAPESPLRATLVNRLGEATAEDMSNAMVDAIAQGINPRTVARQFAGQGLTWSLQTARTAQLWAYREATRANYIANRDVVDGWYWLSALDGRTCMSCISQHGSFHSVEEVLADHHQGRCTAAPSVPLANRLGIGNLELEPGEQWFDRQPEAVQLDMMGPGKFEAWKDGAFEFSALSSPYDDVVYGQMLRETTLGELVQ